jgi:hypothetical protein
VACGNAIYMEKNAQWRFSVTVRHLAGCRLWERGLQVEVSKCYFSVSDVHLTCCGLCVLFICIRVLSIAVL